MLKVIFAMEIWISYPVFHIFNLWGWLDPISRLESLDNNFNSNSFELEFKLNFE